MHWSPWASFTWTCPTPRRTCGPRSSRRAMPEHLLPTTLVGSLPRPAWLATPENVRPDWRLEGDLLREGQDDAVLLALQLQDEVGLDVVTDGEQRRRHYIDSFCAELGGFDYGSLV